MKGHYNALSGHGAKIHGFAFFPSHRAASVKSFGLAFNGVLTTFLPYWMTVGKMESYGNGAATFNELPDMEKLRAFIQKH